jgi:unsaturated chondroitin disaccharide hydrolase
MMNLPLLYSASALTGNPDYLAMADHHARTALEHQIRPDYSTYHTFDFDPETGRPIGGFNEGGYSDDSTWARGQAWGIYGFALAYRHTGKQEYAEAAQGLAEYFLKYLPDDNVPYWDYALPDFNRALKDTSAAAIAACGIIEMHHLTGGRGPWASYRLRAEQMLGTLQAGYSAAEDPLCEGLLKRTFARIDGVEWELYSIWGDYFYMEGLLMLSGCRPDAWSLEVGKP